MVEQFKYLGTTSIQEEIKSRLKSWDLLSCSVLYKNIQITIYITIILPVVLYGCETWSLTLMECRLRVFKNSVLRRIFGPKKVEVTEEWKKLYNELLNDLYSTILFR